MYGASWLLFLLRFRFRRRLEKTTTLSLLHLRPTVRTGALILLKIRTWTYPLGLYHHLPIKYLFLGFICYCHLVPIIILGQRLFDYIGMYITYNTIRTCLMLLLLVLFILWWRTLMMLRIVMLMAVSITYNRQLIIWLSTLQLLFS